jgi:hypothetical protein
MFHNHAAPESVHVSARRLSVVPSTNVRPRLCANTIMARPVEVSHTRAVLSSLPVISNEPSLDSHPHLTFALWPLQMCDGCLRITFQIRAVQSFEMVTRRSPFCSKQSPLRLTVHSFPSVLPLHIKRRATVHQLKALIQLACILQLESDVSSFRQHL